MILIGDISSNILSLYYWKRKWETICKQRWIKGRFNELEDHEYDDDDDDHDDDNNDDDNNEDDDNNDDDDSRSTRPVSPSS